MATYFDHIEYLVVRRFPFANALRGPPSLLSMAGGNAYAYRQSGLPEIETYKEELRNKKPADLQKLYDEELAKEAAEQFALAESEEQSRFFNQPYAKADVGHWSKAAYWTLDEAIALSFGKAPDRVTSETMKPFVDVSPFAHQYWRRRDLALRAAASKQLSDPTLPGPFLAWAKRTDLAVPSELEAAVTARGVQIADWKTYYDDLKKKCDGCHTQWLALSKEQSEQIDRLRSINEELQKQLAGAAPAPHDRPEKSLGTRERDSLLKLVIGMAVGCYRYNATAPRNERHAEIASDLARAGVPLDVDTIRKWLKEAANLLPEPQAEQD
jgi:hypothetical protein